MSNDPKPIGEILDELCGFDFERWTGPANQSVEFWPDNFTEAFVSRGEKLLPECVGEILEWLKSNGVRMQVAVAGFGSWMVFAANLSNVKEAKDPDLTTALLRFTHALYGAGILTK